MDYWTATHLKRTGQLSVPIRTRKGPWNWRFSPLMVTLVPGDSGDKTEAAKLVSSDFALDLGGVVPLCLYLCQW